MISALREEWIMEFRDLKKQYQLNKSTIDHAIMEVVAAANFISGQQVAILEQQLASYVDAQYCVTCANGTDALQIALMAWNIKDGDAVFVPDFTFFSSGEVISLVGATPVFVDVREDTYNIDVDSLSEVIEQVIQDGKLIPRVIVAVDLFGQPAEYDKLRMLADKYHMYILEDAAQGFGGSITGKMAGSFGDIATTSFFPAKPLGCYGDGGAIFTDNEEWAKLIKSICVHGKGSDKYDNIRIGLNSRLDTLQAAILDEKLKIFTQHELDDVNKVADWYYLYLGDCVGLPVILSGYRSSWAQYTIRCANSISRCNVQSALKDEGIPSMIYYQKPMHKQLAFSGSKFYLYQYNNTERLCERVLSLPMHPYMTEEDVKKVARIVRSVVEI